MWGLIAILDRASLEGIKGPDGSAIGLQKSIARFNPFNVWAIQSQNRLAHHQ